MKRLSLIGFALFAVMAVVAACGDDDDSNDGNNSAETPTEVSDEDPPAEDSQSNGGGNDGLGEFFQLSGTGVLTILLDGETLEFDVTCSADKGKTFDDEPQWDYSLESADAAVIVQGTYQLVGNEETFKSLLVASDELTLSASEFADVTSGGTEWAGTFTSAGIEGPIEGTFETSCS